jgi:hypothetical protein
MAPEQENWREIFRMPEVSEPYKGLPTEPGDCNGNCLEAKELVCVCRCGGKNHGAALKKHVRPLDEFNDPVKDNFSPEEYREELAVLA